MAKRKTASKKMVGIRCQCQDRPVPIEKEKIRTVRCPKCGKVYKTNRLEDICFDCRKK